MRQSPGSVWLGARCPVLVLLMLGPIMVVTPSLSPLSTSHLPSSLFCITQLLVSAVKGVGHLQIHHDHLKNQHGKFWSDISPFYGMKDALLKTHTHTHKPQTIGIILYSICLQLSPEDIFKNGIT